MESDSSNSQCPGESPQVSPEGVSQDSQESHSSSAQSLSPGENAAPVSRPPVQPMTEAEKQCYSLITIMKESGEYYRLCREVRTKLLEDGYEVRLRDMTTVMIQDMIKNDEASDEELKRFREQALDRIMPVAMNSISENVRKNMYDNVRAIVERHLEFTLD